MENKQYIIILLLVFMMCFSVGFASYSKGQLDGYYEGYGAGHTAGYNQAKEFYSKENKSESESYDTLGYFKQGACIDLKQKCSNCSYNKIYSISLPDKTTILIENNMTKNNVWFNYTFCDTMQIGEYNAIGFGDIGEVERAWSYDFYVVNAEESA